jgi:peptidoglycan/LPS O-acetylase OafA/YrhL
MNYRPEIDGLRAIAVLSVLLCDAGIGFFAGGFLGVDVFFVISGYLICNLIIEQLTKKQFSFARFYERRVRRLFPALFLVTLVSFVIARQWMLYNDFRQFSQSIVAVYTLMPNMFFWDQVGYFTTIADLQPLLHTWSLGIEEQFYLMFPLLLVATRLRLHSGLPIVLFTLLLVSGVIAGIMWQPSADTSSAFYLLPSRFWEFLAGAVLALPMISANRADTPVATLASVLGLLGIVLGVLANTPNNSSPGLYMAFTVVATSVLLYFTHPGKLVYIVLCGRPLITIGLASYSIYLWHQPVFVFARIRFGEAVSHTLFSWALMLLVVFLGWLTWRFVEQPFRGSGLLSRRQVFSIAAGVSLCVLTVGLTGHFSNGISPPHNLGLSQRLEQAVGLTQDCDGRVGVPDCQTHQQPEIIVFGDSYAMQ